MSKYFDHGTTFPDTLSKIPLDNYIYTSEAIDWTSFQPQKINLKLKFAWCRSLWISRIYPFGKNQELIYLYIYIYIYVYIDMCINLFVYSYIYIYIERERYIIIHIIIYITIYNCFRFIHFVYENTESYRSIQNNSL